MEQTVAERERMREALLAAGLDCPTSAANFVVLPGLAGRADELEAQGLVVRRVPDAIRITVRLPAENDRILAALGAAPAPAAVRSALVLRTSAETALRIGLALDGQGRVRAQTGIGFFDHLLAQLGFHGGLDLEVVAGGDLDVDQHHTVEDVLAALGDALGQALDGRAGVRRYGSATVPMDEARATAAIDLVRRPHAEVALAFTGDHVGGPAADAAPARARALCDPGRADAPRRGVRRRRPPRRRGGVQGRRPGAARGLRAGRRATAVHEGRAVKAILVDYGAGNLRSVSSAFARAGVAAEVTADPAAVREAQLAVIAGVGNAESAAAPRWSRTVLRTSCGSAPPPGGPCSASASACSSSSRRARKAGTASACCAGR